MPVPVDGVVVVVLAGGVDGAIVSAGGGVVVVVVLAAGGVAAGVSAASSEPEHAARVIRAEAQSAREIFFMSNVHLFECTGPSTNDDRFRSIHDDHAKFRCDTARTVRRSSEKLWDRDSAARAGGESSFQKRGKETLSIAMQTAPTSLFSNL
ncbi:MAG: hypothetical protein H7Y08_03225 [Rhizobiaceae bacterium]|nr:hypothetical protein [Rhizobiaceae bacterium]